MISKTYYKLFPRILYFYHSRFRKKESVLVEKLINNNQTRWLDLGSSSCFNLNFYFADIHNVLDIPIEMRSNYFRIDATKPLTNKEIDDIGTFDLIRMQHVFEHFTFEDGMVVLNNCYSLLKSKGYLLISVPDLNIFIKRYRRKALQLNWPFTEWALKRIPDNSPQSFFFSVFTHSVSYQKHLWCYDKEGLFFQIKRSGKYSTIKKIGLFNKLCNIPFTHNRPLEDLCVLAKKI